MKRLLLTVLSVAVLAPASRADIKPHALISDNMVLQQGVKAPLWGTGDEGEKVTVAAQGQEVSTVVKDGKWLVQLEPLKAGGPVSLKIVGKNAIEIKNVLVGEVWIASGQSNMEWSVNASENPAQVKNGANFPSIRFFHVPHKVSETPLTEVAGRWVEVTPDTIGNLSAVAYHFARDLHKASQVPVGILQSAWGGTIADAWTSRAALEANPAFKQLLPKTPIVPNNPNQGTVLYNGMIAPLQPYAVKGAIWYQGESNAFSPDRALQYRELFPAMIQSWRDAWKNPEMPFLFVQLAPWDQIPQGPWWALLRESQLLTTKKLKHTGMAVITDIGDRADIHPRPKEPVGARLALAARAIAYGEKVPHSGPVFDSMKVEGNKAILAFAHVGMGLESKGGALTGFTVAGEDKEFHEAKAEIVGAQVVVTSDKVTKPVAVRYGWANFPVVNLWNKDGLPATPFRTDSYPVGPVAKK